MEINEYRELCYTLSVYVKDIFIASVTRIGNDRRVYIQ
jgi:hypothetical protein